MESSQQFTTSTFNSLPFHTCRETSLTGAALKFKPETSIDRKTCSVLLLILHMCVNKNILLPLLVLLLLSQLFTHLIFVYHISGAIPVRLVQSVGNCCGSRAYILHVLSVTQLTAAKHYNKNYF